VVIPNKVSYIGEYAFAICRSLRRILIPDSVTEIGDEAFLTCTKLTAIEVGVLNPAYSSLEGVLFDKQLNTLIRFPAGKAGTFIIPDSVTSIVARAFGGSTGLTSVTILTA
jgi:hypothetical protein